MAITWEKEGSSSKEELMSAQNEVECFKGIRSLMKGEVTDCEKEDWLKDANFPKLSSG